MITREQIASALQGVGLAGSPVRPAVPGANAAWPSWRSSEPLVKGRADCAYQVRWYVFVALTNADLASSVEASTPLIGSVTAALVTAGLTVDLVEPVMERAEPGGAGIPLLRFTCRD